MLEIVVVGIVVLALPVLGHMLYHWFQWRRFERDPRQVELANHLVGLATGASATPGPLMFFVAMHGWEGREAANRITHAVGIPQKQLPKELWDRTVAIGQQMAKQYRYGKH